MNPLTGKPLDAGTTGLEPAGNAKKNGGFFAKGIMKAMENSDVENHVREVKVMGNGHCHGTTFVCLFFIPIIILYSAVTENCRRVSGVWLCFGGGG
jgi:hypothetical protein